MQGMPNPFEIFEKLIQAAVDSVMDYAYNYMFGVLAVLFWARTVSGLTRGQISVISIVLAVIFTAMAITAGQDFWKVLPFFQ